MVESESIESRPRDSTALTVVCAVRSDGSSLALDAGHTRGYIEGKDSCVQGWTT